MPSYISRASCYAHLSYCCSLDFEAAERPAKRLRSPEKVESSGHKKRRGEENAIDVPRRKKRKQPSDDLAGDTAARSTPSKHTETSRETETSSSAETSRKAETSTETETSSDTDGCEMIDHADVEIGEAVKPGYHVVAWVGEGSTFSGMGNKSSEGHVRKVRGSVVGLSRDETGQSVLVLKSRTAHAHQSLRVANINKLVCLYKGEEIVVFDRGLSLQCETEGPPTEDAGRDMEIMTTDHWESWPTRREFHHKTLGHRIIPASLYASSELRRVNGWLQAELALITAKLKRQLNYYFS